MFLYHFDKKYKKLPTTYIILTFPFFFKKRKRKALSGALSHWIDYDVDT